MAHLVADFGKYFQFDEINIDNWHFKLYYKGCTLLFFTGSLVGVLSQYFGDPINCDFTTIDSDVANDYCWIHGSSYIPPEYQPHMRCITDLDGVVSEDNAPDTSYYQWVVFMQLFQAGIFYLPYKFWQHFEGGLISSFGTESKSAIMLSNARDQDYQEKEGGVVMEKVIDKFVHYFRATMHRNQWYFAKYIICEVLNFFFIFLNFIFTDKFLQGRFRYYGVEAVQYYFLTQAERRVTVSPFCAAFPTEVSCVIPNIGAAGGEQNHNGLCILTQNIINEKIYLAIWFYLVFVFIVSAFYMCYRALSLFFPQLRMWGILSRVANSRDDELEKATRYVLNRCYLGDWFLLNQLSKNVNIYFFRAFIKELKMDLKERPNKKMNIRSGASSVKGSASNTLMRPQKQASSSQDKNDTVTLINHKPNQPNENV